MPWVPELFSAPVLQQVLDRRRRDALVAVPYFDGLLAGDPDPLVESFAGVPELYDPVRGRVKDEAAFRVFVTETSAWLREHDASVDDQDASTCRSPSSPSAGRKDASTRSGSTSTPSRSPAGVPAARPCFSPTPD